MKISCANSMIPGRSLTEKAENLKKWGYDAITLLVEYNSRSDKLYNELINIKKNTGVDICEFYFIDKNFGQHMNNDKKIHQKAMEIFYASIDMCREINALTGIGFEYKAVDPLPLFDFNKKMPEDVEKKFLNILKTLGSYAAEKNVPFLLESINRYETRYLNTLEACREIIDKTNIQDKIGIIADFFHLSIEESNIPGEIRASKGYIKHVHLGENNRKLPGYGSINWIEGFRALKSIGYDDYVALECAVVGAPEESLPKCADFLREIIDKA